MSEGKAEMSSKSIRSSQVISPYGVGAIFEFGDESFVALGTEDWPHKSCTQVRLPRLEAVLKVDRFLSPPVAPGSSQWGRTKKHYSVPFMRFPTWLFCVKCRRLYRWRWIDEEEDAHPTCKYCRHSKARLAPMRFMAVCDNGHLADVDWARWAHSPAGKPCAKTELAFEGDPSRGGGLQSLKVRCLTCGKARDLGGIVRPNAMKSIGVSCPGKHPWQRVESAVSCERPLAVVQRGDSNAYYPRISSALDISTGIEETDSGAARVLAHSNWSLLEQVYEAEAYPSGDSPALASIIGIISQATKVDESRIWELLKENSGEQIPAGSADDGDDPSNEALVREEWRVLSNPPPPVPGSPFVAVPAPLDEFGQSLPDEEQGRWREFRRLVKGVVLAKRIRMIRAFTGFSRIDPSGQKVPPSLEGSLGWLPATEIYGEGVFVMLDLDAVKKWEDSVGHSYAEGMRERLAKSGYDFLPDPSPRFVLLHTLSHLLIRQLCFDCGYSASSLAEKIYCGEDMAGILIYTASSDSEGALGGLVREAEPPRFYGIFRTALARAAWCSNDPICGELSVQGFRGLNKAACHACALVAETSCMHANALLDRSCLYGDSGRNLSGFFTSMLDGVAEA